MPEEKEIICITLPATDVDGLKESAWQTDMSVPELMNSILETATRDLLSMSSEEEDLRKEAREGWQKMKGEFFRSPPRWLGRRKRKTRQATVAEDGEWRPAGDGLLMISLPVTKHRKQLVERIAVQRNSSVNQEAARIIQEGLKGDFRPRTDEEWEQQIKVWQQEVFTIVRDIFRHLWSSGGKRR